MRSDTVLDYAVFQLSPKHSRCELFVSGDGKTEKLASGLLKPFATHLKIAEEQVAQAAPSIKLEVKKHKNEGTWFTKGTLERFVRFVSTPDVLELVIKIDAEMSQLEAARKIYLQGAGNQVSSTNGGDGIGATTSSADITKKELLRAIDVRLVTVRQDLTTACARASAAGFTVETVSELQFFSDQFGAHRLNEACTKFISLSQKRPDLNPWKARGDDPAIRSSFESDMSIDDPSEDNIPIQTNESHQFISQQAYQYQHRQKTEQQASHNQEASQHQASTHDHPNSSIVLPDQDSSKEPDCKTEEGRETEGSVRKKDEEAPSQSPQLSQPSRRLSVQDRINLFENKQKEQGTGSGGKVVVGKSVELRRLSSDVSSSGLAAEKAVLRRWSGASDMSMDLSSEKKDTESSVSTPCSTSNSLNQTSVYPSASASKDKTSLKDTATSSVTKFGGVLCSEEHPQSEDKSVSQNDAAGFSHKEEVTGSMNQIGSEMQPTSSSRAEGDLKDTDSVTNLGASFDSSDSKDQPVFQPQLKASSIRPADGRRKYQVLAEKQTQSKASMDRKKDLDFIDQAASQYQPFRRTSSDVTLNAATKDHISSLANFRVPFGKAESVGSNDWTASVIHSNSSFGKVDDVGSADEASQVRSVAFPSRVDNTRLRHQPANLANLRASPDTSVDVGMNLKERSTLKRQTRDFTRNLVDDSRLKDQGIYKDERDSQGDALNPPSQWSSYSGKSENAANKDVLFPDSQFGTLSARAEGSSRQELILQRQNSASEKSHNLPGKRGETTVHVNGDPLVHRRKIISTPEMTNCSSTAPVEQIQKGRLSKGNQILNDELQTKADDLEKLFAAHKLRVPGDQSAVVRRSKPAELQVEPLANASTRKMIEVTPPQLPKKVSLREPRGGSNDVSEYDPQIIDDQDDGNIADVGRLENARGKLYDMYVQKRDAKLKEEWSSNRGQKEAKMKAMQDYLESSSAEIKAKFAGSADRQDSVLNASRRAEKLRSFNIRSAMKIREQHPIEFLQSEEDGDQYVQERLFGDIGDGSSRSVLSKRLLANRTTFSSTPRTSAALFSRSSGKPSNSNFERRRTQPENPLAQSVPNFSDLRKENTRPSPGISKVTTRSQSRGSRSKTTGEELPLVKEEKPRRSQSMRKNSAGSETKEATLNSEGIVLTSLKFDKEQTEQSLYNKVLKNGESKPFLRKGNGIRASTGTRIAKLKASMASESMKAEEDTDDLEDQFEDSVDMIQGEEDESEAVVGDELKTIDCPADSDNEKLGVSMESVKSGDPELESEELLRSLGSVDPDSVDEAVDVAPSMFHTSVGTVLDSPGESPASWNSRGHHPFSYAQEASDVDGFVESPMGSPASWNSHSLTQIEADAARMRKKWGSAQKTIIVSNASSHQTRKDVTKGFKRLLKFGRKSRGTESLVDWISATTSEGDDDTEDGCDLANRSSDDLRKSRMGFSQDGFNDGELFNEHVQALRSSIPTPPANFKLRDEHLSGSSLKAPRSFFSLSSFRSKGSESKPR